jgi:hypothetical protein
MDERWVSFREGTWASFGATLPASLPVGRGWRGGHARSLDSIEALDSLVEQVAGKAGAAVGVWRADAFAYGIAASAETEPIPFLLDIDLSNVPEEAAEAIVRCGVGSSVTGWRQRTAQELSAWSVHAPRAVDPLEMDAAMQVTDAEADPIETWCRLLGMAVPVDREPDPADAAAQARAALTLAAERRRQRRSADVSW